MNSDLNRIIKHHFNTEIAEKYELPGCRKEGFALYLANGKKVVFRAQKGYHEVFLREKFFYDSINRNHDKICPEVYVVDGTEELYDKPYQISEYINGISAEKVLLDDSIGEEEKRGLYYKIGETIAHINQIEIEPTHPYVADRVSNEDFFAQKIEMQLNRLIKNNLITKEEIHGISTIMRSKKATQALHFLHRDFRPMNMILCDNKLFVIDAETCEFGDPLNELAFIRLEWTYWDMFDVVLEGYKSVFDIDTKSRLIDFYILERLGEILDMHYNYDCSNRFTEYFSEMLHQLKRKIIG